MFTDAYFFNYKNSFMPNVKKKRKYTKKSTHWVTETPTTARDTKPLKKETDNSMDVFVGKVEDIVGRRLKASEIMNLFVR